MSTTKIKLLVGLANPGKEYSHTRHNAGAWYIERLAQIAGTELRNEPKFHGLFRSVHLEKHTCQLLVPTTFMNLSGQSVQACLAYQKLNPQEMLVAHDDIDLPAGVIRLKYDGGDGGHNGLKDIIRHLRTKQFYRLRIGVGRPHKEQALSVVDYVLNPPSKKELEMITDAFIAVDQVLPFILNGELHRAMQELHTSKEE